MRINRNQVLAIAQAALAASPNLTALGRGAIHLDQAQADDLMRRVRAATTPQRVVRRSVVVLLSASGWSNARIATALGVSRHTVALWKSRFAGGGTAALLVDAPGRGRKPGRNHEIVARIVAMTNQRPPNGDRWTVRTLAQAVGVSHATVHRVWREQSLVPADAGQTSEVEALPPAAPSI